MSPFHRSRRLVARLDLRWTRLAIVGAVAVLAVANLLPSSDSPSAPAGDEAIDAWLDAQVADAGYPGASVAIVRNGRLDLLYANDMGRALFSEVFRDPRGPNNARFTFLDPRARLFWPDWERAASDTVAMLHAEAGRNPYDRSLAELIGELSTRSDEFRVRWAAHDVKNHRSGTKQLRHPLVGELTLTFESLELSADPGLSMSTYSAEPGSASEARLIELAAWASTRSKLAGVDDADETAGESVEGADTRR